MAVAQPAGTPQNPCVEADMRTRTPTGFPVFLLVVLIACGDDGGPSAPGAVKVVTATGGFDLDPDGYTVTLDNERQQSVGTNAEATFASVAVGEHLVELTDYSTNCSVGGNNPRTVTVSEGNTASTTFLVTCEPSTGQVAVLTATAGPEPDPDGYLVSLDGVHNQSIDVNGSTTFNRVSPGDHEVSLTGLADNCQVLGANPRTVTVSAGNTTSTTFSINCDPTTGAVMVQTSTTGIDLDSDGYTATLDGGQSQWIDANGSVTFSGISPGDHVVELTGVALQCAVGEFNPRTVTVAVGSTAGVVFAVACGTSLSGRIAYVSWDLYVVNLPDLTSVTIASSGNAETEPDWSPDGTRLVYVEVVGGASFNMYTINDDGTNKMFLGSGYSPRWSPDGSQIVFVRGGQIFVMNASGGGERQLTYGLKGFPDWSPDGSRIVYDCKANAISPRDICVMNADGTGQATLAQTAADEFNPVWSSDGAKIAFAVGSVGDSDVAVMNADGSGRVVLTSHSGNDWQPEWSPDDKWIAFVTSRNGGAIAAITPDGQTEVRIIDGGGQPAWTR